MIAGLAMGIAGLEAGLSKEIAGLACWMEAGLSM
jgi:hypothetical protein